MLISHKGAHSKGAAPKHANTIKARRKTSRTGEPENAPKSTANKPRPAAGARWEAARRKLAGKALVPYPPRHVHLASQPRENGGTKWINPLVKPESPQYAHTGMKRRETDWINWIKKPSKADAPRYASVSGSSSRPAFMKRIKRLGLFHKLLISAAALVLALVVGVMTLFFHFYGLMGSESGATTPIHTAGATPDVSPLVTSTPEPTPGPTEKPLTPEEQAAKEEMELRASLQKDAESILASEDVYNILLLGSDGRTEEEAQRSDAMILVSINTATRKIWLTSFMRDTQVTIINPNGTVWGTGHLNWTFSNGGVEMLTATIESEKNFAIHIDNWMQVDFLRFAEIANLVGPVTVTVTPEEAESMNKRVQQVCRLYDKAHGLSGTKDIIHRSYFPEQGGTVTITDGIQILAYCRERQSGGDVARTQRQREILIQMWENVKNMSLVQQFNLLETVLKYINTDLSPGECASLLLMATSLVGYDIHTQQCPSAGAFREDRDSLNLYAIFADYPVCRNVLRASIYGEHMDQADLTSWCTGTGILVFDPENLTYFDPVTYTMH